MRLFWSGVLMAGMLLVLWGMFEAQQTTSDPVRYYGEDGTPFPPAPTPRPPSQS